MLQAFILSISQLSDRSILLVLLKTLSLSLALFAILGVGAYYGLVWLFAWLDWSGGGFAAAAAAAIIAILTGLLLFRVVAMFVLNIFSDDIVDAVERRHYPQQAEAAKPPGYLIGMKMGIASTGRAIGYNILASPVYVLLLVTGVGAPLAFFIVNAILIGRDLHDMVASRHINNIAELPTNWRIGKAQRFILGLATALLLAIPVVNFLAPILAAAMATHFVHQRGEEEPLS
jgi:uncharacterized protein involved in cysteine biosynthesis